MKMRNATSEYRKLVVADESLESLDRAMRLAARVASGRGGANDREWRVIVPERPHNGPRHGRAMRGGRRVGDVVWTLTTIPQAMENSQDRIPDEQYSILMDTLLLVFHHALFVLLPAAPADRDRLLTAFTSFITSLHQPQEKFHLTGLLELETGNTDAAVDAFRAALAATHVDDHDFMSRVQMVWAVLMERAKPMDAFEMLLDVYPRVLRTDLEEVSNLLRETFAHLARQGKPVQPRGLARKRA